MLFTAKRELKNRTVETLNSIGSNVLHTTNGNTYNLVDNLVNAHRSVSFLYEIDTSSIGSIKFIYAFTVL